jgi:restriction endonuclease Mrr
MLPLLKLAAEREWRISDAVDRLADEFKISLEERAALLPSGRQTTIRNRVAWAKSYLVKAGLLKPTKRGHFCISDQGRNVLANPPERITIKYLNQFPEFQEFRRERELDPTAPQDSDTAHESKFAPVLLRSSRTSWFVCYLQWGMADR